MRLVLFGASEDPTGSFGLLPSSHRLFMPDALPAATLQIYPGL